MPDEIIAEGLAKRKGVGQIGGKKSFEFTSRILEGSGPCGGLVEVAVVGVAACHPSISFDCGVPINTPQQ